VTEPKTLIILVGLIYGYIAIDQACKQSLANTIVYAGYAFSNIGLWMLAK
jgi:hypothetical protein